MNIDQIHPDIVARAKNIKLLVLDVDGVMSDGKLYFSNNGDEIKTFHSLDGHGIKMLKKSGVEVGIITGRTSLIVEKRANNLGINLLLQGREDKLNALEELINHDTIKGSQLNYSQIAHMGDDYPDVTIIRRVGLGLTPANGHWIVKQHAHWQSQFNGGEGAVREACDLIMLSQGTFDF